MVLYTCVLTDRLIKCTAVLTSRQFFPGQASCADAQRLRLPAGVAVPPEPHTQRQKSLATCTCQFHSSMTASAIACKR